MGSNCQSKAFKLIASSTLPTYPFPFFISVIVTKLHVAVSE